MFTMGILSSFILLFVCGFIEKRCERSGGFWGVQPGINRDFDYMYGVSFSNPETASIEELEMFLKKNEMVIPRWWQVANKGNTQFTPEQIKCIERFIADMKARGRICLDPLGV